MGYLFNPTTGKLDTVSDPGGSDTQIQFNDGGLFGGVSDLTYNKTTKLFTNRGDISLDDGGSFTTTLQTITATANRTIALPDATGTVALVAGSSGQLLWNNSGANAGASTLTYDGAILTSSGRFINSYTSLASSPAKIWTGTWFTGGTSTTTKPHVLIEPTGTTSTAWSTSGTGLGINAPSGFAGNLLDLQVNGTSRLLINRDGVLTGGVATFGLDNSIGAWLRAGTAFQLSVDTDGIGFRAGNGVPNTYLVPETNNLLAQRNGTNAQTFRCYGTYTNASNYVRAALSSSSTAVTLAAESAGTGAADVPLNLTAKGTGTVKVNSVAEVAASSTVAGLPAAPAVGMITRVTDASAPTAGSTVTGGGSANALCWYNGSNWTVLGV